MTPSLRLQCFGSAFSHRATTSLDPAVQFSLRGQCLCSRQLGTSGSLELPRHTSASSEVSLNAFLLPLGSTRDLCKPWGGETRQGVVQTSRLRFETQDQWSMAYSTEVEGKGMHVGL